jgi:hypothetical protein
MHAAYIATITGCTIGPIGGLVGTYCSIKNTNRSKERAFMVKASIVVWAGIILFLGLMLILPNPYRYFLWKPYSVFLPLGIICKEEIESQRVQVL